MMFRAAVGALLWLAPLPTLVSDAAAQGPALEVFGLVPGGTVADLQESLAKMGAKPVCKISPADRRVSECTATLTRTPDHRNWAVIATTVDGTAGVLLLRASIDSKGFDALREEWTARLGRPNLKHLANLDSYQWIRAGRMLKLTGRNERGRYEVTVSLVEGVVLDRLGGG